MLQQLKQSDVTFTLICVCRWIVIVSRTKLIKQMSDYIHQAFAGRNGNISAKTCINNFYAIKSALNV